MDTIESVKDKMYSRFIPLLHYLLKAANPLLYYQWQGNCCRQTAIIGCYILDKLLPDYEWEAWDGEFDDIVYNKQVHYNHAWIYGKNKAGGKDLFVDLARQHHERIFKEVDDNKYPNDIPDYENMVETKREKLNWESFLINENEYYTGLLGIQLANAIWEGMRDNE
jgi:hypothetical protein